MKKAYLVSATDACVATMVEHNGYRESLKADGYSICGDPDIADVLLVSTCAFTQEMEDRSAKLIENLKQSHPGKEIRIVGCLPKVNPDRMRGLALARSNEKTTPVQWPRVTPRVDPQDCSDQFLRHKIARHGSGVLEFLSRKRLFTSRRLLNVLSSAVVNPEFKPILIARGCLGKCTYCGIRRAKGSLKSRPLQDIVDEFEAELARGVRKFWLLGDDIGGWGQDCGADVTVLLSALLRRPDKFELVVHYLDPAFLVGLEPMLVPLLRDPRIIAATIPLQSGSDSILKRMGREYVASDVTVAVQRVRESNPALAFKTNYIVGFPGESWADFFRTAASVFRFDSISALPYSPRPLTPASKYTGQIPERIKKVRLHLLQLVILTRHALVVVESVFSRKKSHG